MLDAPVSGGPSGAARASSRSGSAATRPRSTGTRPCSTRWAISPRYIGPIGTATVAKLVHNMSGYAITCALAETFAMGVKAGVEPLALWEAVRQGAAGRRLTFDGLIDQFLPGKYDPPDFALKLAHKDVGARDRARPRARRADAHLQSRLRRDDRSDATAAGTGAISAR